MNAVNSKAYQEWQAKCQTLFTPEYRFPGRDRTEKLADGFSVRFQVYHGEIEGRNLLYVSENTLYDKTDKAVFTWRNLDADGELVSLFRHANGRHYLVFRIDLYGYGVVELESGRELHYIPASAYPEEGESFQETFIWTGADYDPKSSLLAVDGCYWACPASAIVLDFSDPLAEQPVERWFDVRDIVDPEDTTYEDIELVGWDNGVLCLKGDGESSEIRLTAKEIKEHMKTLMCTTKMA